MNGKISIIAPVYNVEKYIDRFIKSVLKQTYSNWELILIDDGSTDDSGKICDRYASNDERIIVYHQKNSGVSTARNTGLTNCTGDYISFVDTDDWLEMDMYQCLVNSIKTYNSDMSVCDVYRVNENENIKKNAKCLENYHSLIDQKDIYHTIFISSATLWNKLFLRNAVIDCRFNSKLRYGEDMIFFLDVIPNLKTASVVKEAKYNYVVNRKGNVVSSKLDNRSLEYIQNGIEVYNRMVAIGYPNVGLNKLYFIVNQVLSKVIDQKPRDKKLFISKCQSAIRIPSLFNCIRYCLNSRSLILLFSFIEMRISVSFYIKSKMLMRGIR